MKVLDLQCSHRHAFEGWFASEDDFQSQLARGLIECPMCADKGITKMLSAPRLNLGAAKPAEKPAPADGRDDRAGRAAPRPDASPAPAAAPAAAATEAELQAAWLKMARQVLANTEDVGEKFAEEARKIHYGEAEERGIRGKASREETVALLEEGISVMPLPVPAGLTGPLQ